MAALDFPASPTNGQIYSANGKTYRYNSTSTSWTNSTGVGYTGSQGSQGNIGYTGSASTVAGYTGSQGAGYTGSQGIIGYTGSGGGGGSVTITDDNTTNASYYPVFATAAGGSTLKTASTDLIFNPGTGVLSAGTFQSLSDENQKVNINNIVNALSVINTLRGVTYNWKDNGLPSVGLIAQDVEKHFPELVHVINNKKTLNYNGVIGILTEAVKELSARIQMLESK